MENRFLEIDKTLKQTSGNGSNGHSAYTEGVFASTSSLWADSLSAKDRVLVVLIENGGIDLNLSGLVDVLWRFLPGSSVLPDSLRSKLAQFLEKKIKSYTDNLLESAELALNRYTGAKPEFFGDVITLRDGTASFTDLKNTLIAQSKKGKLIDLFILTHGSGNFISVTGGIDGDKIRAMKGEYGKPLSIRSVYMMNCVGASLNQAWLDAGAKASAGSIKNNYLPEPTMYFFWKNWKEGQTFESAVTSAYRRTIALLNTIGKELLQIIPGSTLVSGALDFEHMDFVRDSAPMIQGQRSVTINTDNLSFAQTISSSLATTVLPVGVLRSLTLSEPDAGVSKAHRVLSQQGVDLIKGFEGFRSKLYDDPAGHCTVGYGTLVHTGKCDGRESEVPYAKGVTEAQATQLLTQEAQGFEKTINDQVQVALNQNQFDALVSFVYNVGGGNFKQSTLLKVLNQGNYGLAPAEFKKWTKAHQNGKLVDLPGLVKRRQAEAELFQKPATGTSQSLFWADQSEAFFYGQSTGTDVQVMTIMQTLAAPFTFDATDWEPLISFRPSAPVQSVIKDRAYKWHVHRIEDAEGEINLDYYPVHVANLPTIDGQSATAESLLKYIRLNINSFVDTKIAEFSPYDNEEAKKWRTDAPTGTVIHIDMKTAGGRLNPDDGSVVVSETAPDHWTFSTIWTGLDRGHPVSGNRQFGFLRDAKGGYIFYTRGADRPTGLLDKAMSSILFSAAHNLWLSCQKKIADYVSNHGGSAAVGTAISVRVPWPTIKSTHHHPKVNWI